MQSSPQNIRVYTDIFYSVNSAQRVHDFAKNETNNCIHGRQNDKDTVVHIKLPQ